MDTGTIIGIIGIIVGSIALVISMLSLFYTRRRTKIMEEQLSIVRKETEKKRTFEEVSMIIREVINTVKQYMDPDYFYFPPLDISRDDILAYMHDNQLKTLKLHIKPQSLRVRSTSGEKKLRNRISAC